MILDLKLPDMGGLELLPTMEEQLPEADFLVVSGNATPGELSRVVRRSTVGLLSKPVEPERLRWVADRIAERRELVKANEELRRQVEQAKVEWESTVDAMDDPILIASASGRVLRANRALCTGLGRSFEQVVGKRAIELIFAEGGGKGIAGARAALCGERFEAEVSNLRMPGTFWAGFYPVELESGPGVVYHLHDITERRRSGERLAGAERRYQELFDQAPVMYVVSRGSEERPVIVDCNRTWLETLGYRREEVIGHPLAELYSESSRRELLERGGYRRAMKGQTGFQERELITKEGEVLQTLMRAVPDVDKDGRVMGTRAAYVDITEWKRTELRLRESEERYRSLFEGSRDAIYVSTEDGELLDINPAGVELFGFESKEALQALKTTDLYADPDTRPRVVREILEKGFVEDAEIRLKKRDGTDLVVLETATAMHNESTGMVHLRGILRDITERKSLEEKLHQAQRMEAVGRLSGGVAHDFNNLLTSIKIYASLALKRCPREGELYHDLKQVADTADRAAELVNQLLAFSRQQLLQPKVLSLNEVVTSLEEILRRTISENVQLTVDLDPDLGMVEADPVQMDQVVMNLILNARDAVAAGGSIRIATRNVELSGRGAEPALGLEGPCVELSVADSGCGMDGETVARVFDPFFTTKEQGKGVGLGLATVYGIVKQSGGDVQVDSRPGQGSVFRVVLPLVVHDAVVSPTAEALEPVRELRGGERILVVEDEEILKLVIGRALREKGYDVVMAKDAETALEILETDGRGLDLLLTDVVLPGMDGRALAEQVVGIHPEARVIWMTGYVDQQPTQQGSWVVKERILRKPFNLTEMEKRVREVLDRGGEDLREGTGEQG